MHRGRVAYPSVSSLPHQREIQMTTPTTTLLVAFAALPLFAQEDDEIERSPQPITATIASDTRIHSSPAGASAGALRKGAEARVVGISDDGWVRIRAADR